MSNNYLPMDKYYTGNQQTQTNDNQKILRDVNAVAGGLNLPTVNGGATKTFIADSQAQVKTDIQNQPERVSTVSGVNPFIQNVTPVSTYAAPEAPNFHFPGVADSIKSLSFAGSNITPVAKASLKTYYQAMMDLMDGRLGADTFYSTVVPILSEIEPFTLNEEDWEALRDATVRTQNYILHYLWSDMQTISKAMDSGFKKYQDSINTWINQANTYYTSADFIPNGAIKPNHLSTLSTDGYLKQNVKYLTDHMCVTIGKTKPVASNYNNGADNYPNKGVIWIEEL